MFSRICFLSREHQDGSTAAHAGESSDCKAGEEGRVGLGRCSPATAQGSKVWGHNDESQLWPQRRLSTSVWALPAVSPPGLDTCVGKSALFTGQGRSWVASHSGLVHSTSECLGLCPYSQPWKDLCPPVWCSRWAKPTFLMEGIPPTPSPPFPPQ